MSGISTVIFDVYETLAHNNTALWTDTFRSICRDQRLDVEPESLYRQWKTLEMEFRRVRLNLEEPEKSPPFKSYEAAWRDCFADAFLKLGLRGDPAAAAKRAVRDMGLREPYQDAVSVLPVVQARWRTGVLSNADDDYLFPVLARLGWEFEAVLSSEGARAYKPQPSPFQQVLDAFGIGPEEAMYVGDTLYDDVLGAKGVGMRAAWINRRGETTDPSLPKPDYEVKSLMELPEILEGLS